MGLVSWQPREAIDRFRWRNISSGPCTVLFSHTLKSLSLQIDRVGDVGLSSTRISFWPTIDQAAVAKLPSVRPSVVLLLDRARVMVTHPAKMMYVHGVYIGDSAVRER